MISFLPKKAQIIQLPILTLEWKEVFVLVWCQLVFSILQLQVRNCDIDNFSGYVFLLLKLLYDAGVNFLPLPIGTKIIDEF